MTQTSIQDGQSLRERYYSKVGEERSIKQELLSLPSIYSYESRTASSELELEKVERRRSAHLADAKDRLERAQSETAQLRSEYHASEGYATSSESSGSTQHIQGFPELDEIYGSAEWAVGSQAGLNEPNHFATQGAHHTDGSLGPNAVTLPQHARETNQLDFNVQRLNDAEDCLFTSQLDDARSDYDAALRWLSTTDPSYSHIIAQTKHEPSTGEWLLRSQEFMDWKVTRNSMVWIHGIRKHLVKV